MESFEPVFHDKLDDFNVLGLAQSVDPVKALLFCWRIPSWIEQVETSGRR